MEQTPRDAGCDALHDDLAVLAVGALTGHERARVVAHLEHCPQCAGELEDLSAAADELTWVLPGASPSEGFTSRTMARIRAEGTGSRRTSFRRVAAAAAVVVVLGMGAGVGAVVSSTDHSPPPTAERSATLRSPTGTAGSVLLVTSGQKGWLVMTLHDAPATGIVTCTLTLDDGTRRAIGRFPVAAGYGSWTASLPVPASSVRWVDVVDSRGTSVASARIR